MAVFNEDFFYDILDGFHIYQAVAIGLLRDGDHLLGQLYGAVPIAAAHGIGGFEDGTGDALGLEFHYGTISFANFSDHFWAPCFSAIV